MAYKEEFMREAIEMASENIDNQGGPFGAVIVKDGEIVGRGQNSVTRNLDPTAHAEVSAIRDACKNLGTFVLEGCEIYSSCEPCPMCLSAIYWAHVDKIYYGATKHDAGDVGFDDSFIYEELALDTSQRKITAEEHERHAAQCVFEKWRQTEAKTKY